MSPLLFTPLLPRRITGAPIELIQPETLKIKALEPVLLLGRQRFANLDLRIRVKGGGHVSQMYGECLGQGTEGAWGWGRGRLGANTNGGMRCGRVWGLEHLTRSGVGQKKKNGGGWGPAVRMCGR